MVAFKQINIIEAKDLLLSRSALLVDIRAVEDYEEDHDELARNLTQEIIEDFVTSTPKNMPLLFLCYHGISSQSVAHYFSQQGFSEVYSIQGGYEEWKKYR